MEAVTYFDRSIHWYTPINLYVQRSAEKLWQISKEAESRKDIKLALIAVKTIRRGFYSARSFYTPGKAWIEKCDERIEKLWAIQNGRQGAEAGENDGGAVRARLQDQESRSPDPFWSSMLLLGLFGWVGSVIFSILNGLRKDVNDHFMIRAHLKWLGFAAGCFVLCIVGMIKA